MQTFRIRPSARLAAALLLVTIFGSGLGAEPVLAGPSVTGDRIRVTLDPAVREQAASGRIIVFLVGADGGGARWSPARGPFWDPPQPVLSVGVTDLDPGASVVIDGSAPSFPAPVDALHGSFAVQAVLDADETERSHLEGPGNCASEVITVDLERDRIDAFELTLSRRLAPRRPRAAGPDVEWIELRSESLSRFYGRDVHHRAGVVLPPAYRDPEHVGRAWPTVYVIPGFGGRHFMATGYARRRDAADDSGALPVVRVVLDPESPLGHHGFVDSPNHGARGTALVTELIPHLEGRYRLAARPAGRVVTGHSSGGWSSLWLALEHPEVFGACWSSAPDPVDFRAFQRADLYADESLYVDAEGRAVPSFRRRREPGGAMEPVMTVRQECLMEHAMHPAGRSGQQWDAWEAMFSPAAARPGGAGPFVGRPVPMFDPLTGRIDRDVVEHWRRFDITRLVTEDWDCLGPVVMQRIRLSCGSLDSFYLERAVTRFKERMESMADAHGGWKGPGYVRIVPGATHGSLIGEIRGPVHEEMAEHFRLHGLAGSAP